ncbi:MAG: hypothetical protein Tsb002_20550 [Wenzhouxiangellaceae bacterium]
MRQPLFALLVKEVAIAVNFGLVLEAVYQGMGNSGLQRLSRLSRRWVMTILADTSVRGEQPLECTRVSCLHELISPWQRDLLPDNVVDVC